MLRITTIDEGQTTTFRLEGRLIGDWVTEFERCWLDIKSADCKRRFRVDISDVENVDEQGKTLLKRLFLAGAELHGGNLWIRAIVADIVAHSNSEVPMVKQ
jgi:ABC-type transporter Mla MlaB component